jgi:hypothetical protein
MTITYDWRIVDLEREVEDGYVFTAHWTVRAVSSDTDTEGNAYEANTYGSISFNRPDTLIPYESLAESIVMQWVKDKLNEVSESTVVEPDSGKPELELIERRLADEITKKKSPQKLPGLPW